MTALEFIAKAREYIGTPFHFGGRVKGVGIDCGGLPLRAAQDLGVHIEVSNAYTRDQALEALKQALNACCSQAQNPKAGDILLFATRRMAGHCGIFTGEDTFIHAYDSPTVGRVVETPLDEKWRLRIACIYRFKEFE